MSDVGETSGTGKLRVIIAEDEAIIAWDLKYTLERMGAEIVAIAATASKVVEHARTGAPDLILMDVTLRGRGTGIDAAREIRKFSQVPIVYLTGNTDLKTDPTVVATRAQGVYTKPPWEHELREIVEIARAQQPASGDSPEPAHPGE